MSTTVNPATPDPALIEPGRAQQPLGAYGAVVLSAVGLLLVGIGDRRGQLLQPHARLFFWVGLLVLFLPPAAAAVGRAASRGRRVALLVWLTIALYLVKVMQAPLAFTFHDEFSTMRTTQTLGETGRLFTANPLIPVHPWYPGLELVTRAISALADVRVFVAGLVVIGLARIALVLLLFVLFERLAATARVGSIAALVYMTNPNFVFFDAQFAYESMALALAALVLVLAVRPRDEPRPWWSLLVVVIACIGVATTHHLTSFVVAAFLVLAVLLARLRGDGVRQPLLVTAALLLVIGAWTGVVGGHLSGYLDPVFHRAWSSFVDLVSGRHGPKVLFHSNAGTNDWWEKLLAAASVVLVLLVLPFALRLFRERRAHPVVPAFAVAIAAYPLLLVMRLTEAGTEVSNRASEFIFVPIAFAASVALVTALRRVAGAAAVGAVVAYLAVLLGGGIVIGWAPWAEVPGRYLVAADSRSIEPKGVEAADWASLWLPAGGRVIADRTNGLLLGSYGRLDPQIGVVGHTIISDVLLSNTYGRAERAVVRDGRFAYIVVDRRLTTGLPLVGFYVEEYERQAFTRTRPLAPAALDKFDHVPSMSRVFDNGVIRIYATGR